MSRHSLQSDTNDVGNNRLVFPPLLSTLSVYLESEGDEKAFQAISQVNKSGKSKRRKPKSKNLLSKSITISPTSSPINAEHTPMESAPKPLTMKKHDEYSSPRKMKVKSAPEEEDDFRFKKEPSEYSTKLPQPHKKDQSLVEKSLLKITPRPPSESKKDSESRRAAGVESHLSPQKNYGDLGFGKAVESIAALKLHNFAMRRRDHVSHKLKLLKEIRGYERENNEELIIAQKYRNQEFLAAWKLRYYVEFMRLNATRHIVDVVEGKNQDLEEECRGLHIDLNESRQLNAELQAEVGVLKSDLGDARATIAQLTDTVAGLSLNLSSTQEELASKKELIVVKDEDKSADTLLKQDYVARIEVLKGELQMTRLTCQELIRTSVIKDVEFQEQHEQLLALQALHSSMEAEYEHAVVLHREDAENALMREEDSEIRTMKLNSLYHQLGDREKAIHTFTLQVRELDEEVEALKAKLVIADSATNVERQQKEAVENDKSALSKILTDLAVKQSRMEADAARNVELIKDLEAKARVAKGHISDHEQTIDDLEQQVSTAQQEIDFLADENEELAREIECHAMYGEDMDERNRLALEASNRHVEYSRFLEEELFSARKLYEKQASLDEDHVAAGDHLADVSDESYSYRASTSRNKNSRQSRQRGSDVGRIEEGLEFDDVQDGTDIIPSIVLQLSSFKSIGNGKIAYNKTEPPERPNSQHSRPSTNPQILNLVTGTSSNNNFGGAVNQASSANTALLEQKFASLVSMLEEKLKTVGDATESLRQIAQTAEAFEERVAMLVSQQQHSTGFYTQQMQQEGGEFGVYGDEFGQQQYEASGGVSEEELLLQQEKEQFVNAHLGMETLFAQIQSSLEQVSQALDDQRDQITQLQDVKANIKFQLSQWRKKFKRANGVEPTEEDKQEQVGDLVAEFDRLKEIINGQKGENMALNAKAVELQTELYHLNNDLENSGNEFFRLYQEQISTYLPDMMLAEGAASEEEFYNSADEEAFSRSGSPTRTPFTTRATTAGAELYASVSDDQGDDRYMEDLDSPMLPASMELGASLSSSQVEGGEPTVGESGMQEEPSVDRPYSMEESVLSDDVSVAESTASRRKSKSRKSKSRSKSRSDRKKSKSDKKRKSKSHSHTDDESSADEAGTRRNTSQQGDGALTDDMIRESVQSALFALNMVEEEPASVEASVVLPPFEPIPEIIAEEQGSATGTPPTNPVLDSTAAVVDEEPLEETSMGGDKSESVVESAIGNEEYEGALSDIGQIVDNSLVNESVHAAPEMEDHELEGSIVGEGVAVSQQASLLEGDSVVITPSRSAAVEALGDVLDQLSLEAREAAEVEQVAEEQSIDIFDGVEVQAAVSLSGSLIDIHLSNKPSMATLQSTKPSATVLQSSKPSTAILQSSKPSAIALQPVQKTASEIWSVVPLSWLPPPAEPTPPPSPFREMGTSYSPPPLSLQPSLVLPIQPVDTAGIEVAEDVIEQLVDAAAMASMAPLESIGGALDALNATSPLQHLYPRKDFHNTIDSLGADRAMTPLKLSSQFMATTTEKPSSRAGLKSASHQERKQAQLAKQAARECTTRLKNEIEQCVSDIENLRDDLAVLSTSRAEVRFEIVKWVFHFTDLCGYLPENIDKIRSRVFQSLVEAFVDTQNNMQRACDDMARLHATVSSTLSQLVAAQDLGLTLGAIRIQEDFPAIYALPEAAVYEYEDPYSIFPDHSEGVLLSDASKPLTAHSQTQSQQTPSQTPSTLSRKHISSRQSVDSEVDAGEFGEEAAAAAAEEESDREFSAADRNTPRGGKKDKKARAREAREKKNKKKSAQLTQEEVFEEPPALPSAVEAVEIAEVPPPEPTKTESVEAEPVVEPSHTPSSAQLHRKKTVAPHNAANSLDSEDHTDWRDSESFDAPESLTSQELVQSLAAQQQMLDAALPVVEEVQTPVLTPGTASETVLDLIKQEASQYMLEVFHSFHSAPKDEEQEGNVAKAAPDNLDGTENIELRTGAAEDEQELQRLQQEALEGVDALDGGNSIISDFKYQQPQFDGTAEDFEYFYPGATEELEPKEQETTDQFTAAHVFITASEFESAKYGNAEQNNAEQHHESNDHERDTFAVDPVETVETVTDMVDVNGADSAGAGAVLDATATASDAIELEQGAVVNKEATESEEKQDDQTTGLPAGSVNETAREEDKGQEVVDQEDTFAEEAVEPKERQYTAAEIEVLKKEYARIKKDLKKWQALFLKTYGRDPTLEDADEMDAEVMRKLNRKDELKDLLEAHKQRLAAEGAALSDFEYSRPTTVNESRPVTAANGTNGMEWTAVEGDYHDQLVASMTTPFANKTAPQAEPEPEPMLPSYTPEQIATMSTEYSRLKKDLKKWKAAFVKERGAEPTMADFVSLDVATMQKIARKEELKAILEVHKPSKTTAVESSDNDERSSPRKAGRQVDRTSSQDREDMSYDTDSHAGSPSRRLPQRMDLNASVDFDAMTDSISGGSAVISNQVLLMPIGPNETPEMLIAEYSKLKKDLRKWKNQFVAQMGREPVAEDFSALDIEVKRQIARKNQLKTHLGEQRRLPSSGSSRHK